VNRGEGRTDFLDVVNIGGYWESEEAEKTQGRFRQLGEGETASEKGCRCFLEVEFWGIGDEELGSWHVKSSECKGKIPLKGGGGWGAWLSARPTQTKW